MYALVVPATTVKLLEVAVIVPCVAVNVVLWASYRVTEAVAAPLVNVTDAGYRGAVTVGPGLEDGPVKAMVLEPV